MSKKLHHPMFPTLGQFAEIIAQNGANLLGSENAVILASEKMM